MEVALHIKSGEAYVHAVQIGKDIEEEDIRD
jgi:hypothetical protein